MTNLYSRPCNDSRPSGEEWWGARWGRGRRGDDG